MHAPVSLKPYNTFGIDVHAEHFQSFTSVEQLQHILGNNSMPVTILGGGSNILFTKDVEGLVLRNEIPGIMRGDEHAGEVIVTSGAGENWHKLVMYCISEGLGGMENLSLIPGSVGASPMQNIGAYGVEIKDIFHSLRAWDTQKNRIEIFTATDCHFGYRESVFKNLYKGRFIILDVSFRLSTNPVLHTEYGAIKEELNNMQVDHPTIRDISNAVISIRRQKLPDPAVTGNAGSFFKNPVIGNTQFSQLQSLFPGITGYNVGEGGKKLAAGWLIEQCGWKGYRRGDAGCHAKQALVLVNYGHATGKEIVALAEEIKNSVLDKFGVELQTEVNIL